MKYVILALLLIPFASAEFATLPFYNESEPEAGYIFESSTYTEGNEGDAYARLIEAGEATEYYFYAYNDNFLSVGKEDLDQFGCEQASGYSDQILIIERQGYCIRASDQSDTYKIFVSDITENHITLSWTVYVPTESEEETSEEVIIEQVPLPPAEEGESGPEGGDAAIDIRRPEELPEDIAPDKDDPTIIDEDDNFITKLAKRIWREIQDHPIYAIVIFLILYSIAGIGLSEIRRRWYKKK